MKTAVSLLFCCSLCVVITSVRTTTYEPNWSSLDKRPIPKWYNDAKFGIFNHWGVYSVHGMGAWFVHYWTSTEYPKKHAAAVRYMRENYKPGFTYADFAPQFTARFFNATKFAEVVKNSGARYYVLTSKHHEGYTLWPSKYSWNWNSNDTGPHRDLVGELAAAFKTTAPDVAFGLYFSQFEFLNPLWLQDQANKLKTQTYVDTVSYPQMIELVNNYSPQVIWSDGDWLAPPEYWKAQEFLAWLYNDSPVKDTVVVNDRWGHGTACKHGGFYNCHDKWNPGVLQKHKWENAMTVDRYGWGYHVLHSDSADYLTIEELIHELASTVSCNGNLLMNVGPTHDGRYIPIFEERMSQMGKWLKVNGEAIYDTRPWVYQQDPLNENVWYTSKLKQETTTDREDRAFNRQSKDDTIVYAIVLKWPKDGLLQLGAVEPTKETTLEMLGVEKRLQWSRNGTHVVVDLNKIPWTHLPNRWAWAIKMEYLKNDNRSPLVEA